MKFNPNFENLVLKGGGVKGTAYAGALIALENNDCLTELKRVAGTSAGAITACLLSLHYKPSMIASILMRLDFTQFKDRFDLKDLNHYGIHSGDKFVDWMAECIINAKFPSVISKKLKISLNKNATFTDFKDAGCRELKVFATNLSTQKIVEFSFKKTPNVKVVDAVRASMSIPVYFDAVKYGEDILVDGGVLYNYPITSFDAISGKNSTIGLFLKNLTGEEENKQLEFSDLTPKDLVTHFYKYTECLLSSVMAAQNQMLEKNPDDLARTINIDDIGISATNFDLSEDCKKALINSGIKAIEVILKQNDLFIKPSSPYFLPKDYNPKDECMECKNLKSKNKELETHV